MRLVVSPFFIRREFGLIGDDCEEGANFEFFRVPNPRYCNANTIANGLFQQGVDFNEVFIFLYF